MADSANKQPKKQGFSLQGFDMKAYKQTEAYVQAIDALYNQAVQEFAGLAGKVTVKPDKPFSFADYPATQAKAQQIVNSLAAKMQAVIVKGSREQWLYACKKNDEFLNHILNTSKVPKKTLAKYQDRNLDALDTFQKRKVAGIDLSKRIWNYTGQMKAQMEMGIDIAVGEGKSAAQLSRDLRQYLVDPDKLFHKVKNKHGQLVLSKNAAAFHPGQGKYRSSYKNAMRLTRSEINMAYRESDQLRWQQLDFVVGFEVKLSNNHTTLINGVPTPFKDICDELEGKYPKWFKFKGWHPQCRCHVVPILMDQEEFNTDELDELLAALKGTEYKKMASKNQVDDVPQSFKDWISDHAEAAQGWKSAPYFIKDNFNGGTIAGGLKVVPVAIKQPQNTEPINSQTEIIKPKISTVYSKVVAEESIIAKNKGFETAIVFDKDGNEVFRKKGGSASVSFTDEEVKLFKDNVFTHNHPLGWKEPEGTIGRIGSSFSPQDVMMAINANASELRAAGPVFTFIMKRPVGGWPMSADMAIRKFRSIESDVQSGFYTLIYRSGSEHRNVVIKRAETIHYHTIWKRFCAENGIEYTKIRTSL